MEGWVNSQYVCGKTSWNRIRISDWNLRFGESCFFRFPLRPIFRELAFRHLRWPRVTIHGVALFPLDVNYYTYLHLQFINLLILFARKTRKPFRKHIWLNTFQDHLKILNVHISRHNYNAALLREINISFTFCCVFPWNSPTSLHK